MLSNATPLPALTQGTAEPNMECFLMTASYRAQSPTKNDQAPQRTHFMSSGRFYGALLERPRSFVLVRPSGGNHTHSNSEFCREEVEEIRVQKNE